jgi:hypothetical protein
MFCGSVFMSAPFQFTVTETFLIEGRGLILSPSFPEPEYRFDKVERVRVETPDHKMFDVDADFDIPKASPMPMTCQILCFLRHTQKSDVPIGSSVTLLNKTAEQVAAPNSRPPSQLPSSPEIQSSDSRRTPGSGGCG